MKIKIIRYYGNIMYIDNVKQLGLIIKKQRKMLKLTQVECAGITGVGVRFLSDLERGKPTCEIGKAIEILNGLGLKLQLDLENE